MRAGCAASGEAASVLRMTTTHQLAPRDCDYERGTRLLEPYEVAHILEIPTRVVRNMLRRGELRDVGPDRRRRIDPQQLVERLSDRPLALAALEAIVAGRLRVPRLGLDAQPASLIESCECLW
jgi:hypothetical protein